MGIIVLRNIRLQVSFRFCSKKDRNNRTGTILVFYQ